MKLKIICFRIFQASEEILHGGEQITHVCCTVCILDAELRYRQSSFLPYHTANTETNIASTLLVK